LSLITQSAWLDVEYGFPLQQWILDYFRIVGVVDTEAESWFSDARVATAVTILRRENDAAARDNNLVRFVQFRRKLSDIVGQTADEQGQQRAYEQLRDRLLNEQGDHVCADYRVRTVRQSDLYERGLDRERRYVGCKWGRYLRSVETLYTLQRDHAARFCLLGEIANVQRGTTTNCDAFFLVTDVSEVALVQNESAAAFQRKHGVSRNAVVAGDIRIVRRSDGVALALEATSLRPMLKTARDVYCFATSRVPETALVVYLPQARASLSPLGLAYVRAGEREGWHHNPSFTAINDTGGNWYTLREAIIAPILFVKTMQYTPFVFRNDRQLLANQRLYNVDPLPGVDDAALFATLNSTIVAAERYASAKGLGREAAIDTEVFSARWLKVPDLRQMSVGQRRRLGTLGRALLRRDAGALLEPQLAEAGLAEATVYARQHPIGEDVWPAELRDETRQQIDEFLLTFIGVPQAQVRDTRIALYTGLLEYTRKAKLLELEARVNRRGQATGSEQGPAQLADEIWGQLLEARRCELRHVPRDFVPAAAQTATYTLAASRRIRADDTGLFGAGTFALQIGQATLEFDCIEKRNLCRLLAEHGTVGEVHIPADNGVCRATLRAITAYVTTLTDLITGPIAEMTDDEEMQGRIRRETLRRVFRAPT